MTAQELRPEIRKLAEWLEREALSNPYGEFGVKVVLHDGNISRVEKSIVENTKPNGNPGGRHESHR